MAEGTSPAAGPPEYNVTGIDYTSRGHLQYEGPLFDVHAHVMRTRPDGGQEEPTLDQARRMLEVAEEFGVRRVWSMCPPEDIRPLREQFGDRLAFNGPISKKTLESPDDEAYQLLDRFLTEGVSVIKFWAAPRGRDRGLFLDSPWRIECARRAIRSGVTRFMVHVADPDRWFVTTYSETAKYGTKPEQYAALEKMLNLFPEATWIAAHMGGDPEHPDHLEALLERHTHLYFDTSATKWQVREVSPRRDEVRQLLLRRPDRFLFGSDLVTRHGLDREHYVSRYWCQRTLWESRWEGPSPIADTDFAATPEGSAFPQLRGLDLPRPILQKVYFENARRLLGPSS